MKSLSNKTIVVKPKYSLQQQKEIVYLIKDYYEAIKHNKTLPVEGLPSIDILIQATTIVDAYLKACNFGLSIKLCNACLSVEKIIAVWVFVNVPKLNLTIGSSQLIVNNTLV